MSGRVFNAAIIGAGIGADHIAGYLAMPDCFRVAMVCDLDEAKAKAVSAHIPGCKTTTDIAEVLNNPDVDIVNICLPPNLHFPVMMDAIAAGKHAVGEKPFTTSLAQADLAVERARETGLQVFPVFQYRYSNGFRQLKHLADKDLLGKPFVASLETHWQRGDAYYEVPWRGKWASECGGAIVGHAIHIHNLITHVLGPVKHVCGFLDTKVNPIETDDCAAISMQLESGALVTSSITLGAAGGLSRMRICYEQVTAESGSNPFAPNAGDWTFTATDPSRQPVYDAACAAFEGGPRWFEGMFEEVHKALIGDADHQVPNLADGRHSIELITALYQSSRERKLVTLPLDQTNALYNGWVPAE